MSEEIELKLLREIENLKKEIKELKGEKKNIPSYSFSKIKDKDLRDLFCIERIIHREIFNTWFNCSIILNIEDETFLQALIESESDLINRYNEEELKIYFLAPILNRVNFKNKTKKMRAFYEESLEYETEDFKLSGSIDFFVSKGLDYPEKPYFFIQEFKRDKEYSNPEPQLLAELIVASELNSFELLKGAYIIGENWTFVILRRLAKHKYEYFISEKYNSCKIEELKVIYRNLLFVKKEIEDLLS
ncbi:MAG: hypothetical protein KDK90_04580 [Leptospiraceae bacterium]|nr:hypothetical protein [Leptospiraceae bacterium]